MNAREITQALGGHWLGTYGRVPCPVPGHGKGRGDRNPSLKLSDAPDGGVAVHCFGACDWRDVKAELRRQGLLPEWHPGADRQHKRSEPEPQPHQQPDHQADEARRIATARALWRAAPPLTPNDPAGRYLTSRGLPGPWPASLRFLREARHPTGVMIPALIAAACKWPERRPVATQITSLTSAGEKADVEPVRWTRGALKHAAVRLAGWAEDKTIVLVEGVEDGLAVGQAMPEAAPWAVLGTSNAPHIILPDGAGVVLALDGDKAGRRATNEAAATFIAQGHRVRVAHLPDGADPASLLRTPAARDAA